MLTIGTALDPGKVRRENQDALGVINPSSISGILSQLLIVADGMGGPQGGATASRLVIEAMGNTYRNAPSGAEPRTLMVKGIRSAHKMILEKATTDPLLGHMGSTVVAAFVSQSSLTIANVGDSRAYLINRDGTRLISHDHSLVAEQVRSGIITQQEARNHPQKNILTMSLSAQRPAVEIFQAQYPLQDDDVILLCSDGLWGPVPESQIAAVVLSLPPDIAAPKLVTLANNNRGPDNISVIVARFNRE